jgi:hypothetical protein
MQGWSTGNNRFKNMKRNIDFFDDPWLNSPGRKRRFPPGALFICAYYVDVMPFLIKEAAFFRQTKKRDELWLVHDPEKEHERDVYTDDPARYINSREKLKSGCACAVPREGGDLCACVNLLYRHFGNRAGMGWPSDFITSGIVDEPVFTNVVARLKKELDDNAEKARSDETGIIKAARELKLNPEPTGKGPDRWRANCPGTNHHLLISAESNTFGCGYCRRKGTVADLVAFVNERRAEQ